MPMRWSKSRRSVPTEERGAHMSQLQSPMASRGQGPQPAASMSLAQDATSLMRHSRQRLLSPTITTSHTRPS